MAREKERTLAIKGKQCIRIGLLSLLCCQILIPVLPPLSTLRPARFDKPRQHVLHELHRPGADAHPAAARLLPVRPAQMRDAEQLLFGVRDVATLPGGKRIGSKERSERRSRRKKNRISSLKYTPSFRSSTQAIGRRTSPSVFSIWCGLTPVTWPATSSRTPTSSSSRRWTSFTDTAKVGQ